MQALNIKSLTAKATAIGATTVAMASTAWAAAPTQLQQGADAAKEGTGLPTDLNNIFSTIANTLIFLVGAIAVIMLIIGGLRYVLSSGNASSVEGAKNTILYAVIGIVVASAAFAIVNFVILKI